MEKGRWDVPMTEDGLRQALRQLEASRAVGDLRDVGEGLLALSHIVNWVRSDTSQSPFDRSRELSMEALEVFRSVQHPSGQVRALVMMLTFGDAAQRESMLAEAEQLAKESGEERLEAVVMGAKGRHMALVDRAKADVLFLEALEIFRRVGDQRGIARTLFALAIGNSDSASKRDFAIEAARLNRTLGEGREATRCMMLAVMNSEEVDSLDQVEALVRQGLQDALDSGYRSQEGMFYTRLASISLQRGKIQEVVKFHRWAMEIEESDGLTALERWENSIEFTKSMIEMAKAQGHAETVAMFKANLKQLRASKPTG